MMPAFYGLAKVPLNWFYVEKPIHYMGEQSLLYKKSPFRDKLLVIMKGDFIHWKEKDYMAATELRSMSLWRIKMC